MTYREHMLKEAAAYFVAQLKKHAGSVPAVALEAGIHRSEVYKKLRQFGITTNKPTNKGNEAWQSLAQTGPSRIDLGARSCRAGH